jgi:hypothetical protein
MRCHGKGADTPLERWFHTREIAAMKLRTGRGNSFSMFAEERIPDLRKIGQCAASAV